MSHTPAEGFEMIEAGQRNQRIVQIGSQRVSSARCAKAHELYRSGVIGDVEMVELTYGRNSPTGAWVYPPPPDLSRANMSWDVWLKDTPKIPLSPERFARWRCWKEYGTGVGGDLMVHLISGMLFTLGWNEARNRRRRWVGFCGGRMGATCRIRMCIFDYHGIPVYVRLDQGSGAPETARFLGPKGVMEANGNTLRLFPQTGEDESPSYYAANFPEQSRAITTSSANPSSCRKVGVFAYRCSFAGSIRTAALPGAVFYRVVCAQSSLPGFVKVQRCAPRQKRLAKSAS